jgi:hypothetical protein
VRRKKIRRIARSIQNIFYILVDIMLKQLKKLPAEIVYKILTSLDFYTIERLFDALHTPTNANILETLFGISKRDIIRNRQKRKVDFCTKTCHKYKKLKRLERIGSSRFKVTLRLKLIKSLKAIGTYKLSITQSFYFRSHDLLDVGHSARCITRNIALDQCYASQQHHD